MIEFGRRNVFSLIRGCDIHRPQLAEARVSNLLGKLDERPDARYVKTLILEHNLTAQAIQKTGKNLGMTSPNISQLFQELEYVLPLIHQVVDTLATEHNQDILLFASRDANLLYDAYIGKFSDRYPDQQVYDLPSSTLFWNSESLKDPLLARRFLEAYGITEEALARGKKIILVDNGFRGTIGEKLRELVSRVYGASDSFNDQIETKLVGMTPSSTAENTSQICDYSERTVPSEQLGWLVRGFKSYYGSTKPFDTTPKNYFALSIATILQQLPQFHDRYDHVEEKYGEVRVVPKMLPPVAWNPSHQPYVHPVASLMIQVETIRYMLGLPMSIGENQKTDPPHAVIAL